MLRWRLLLGVIFVATLVGLLALDHTLAGQGAIRPGTILLPLAVLLAVLGTEEVLILAAARNIRPQAGLVYVGNLAIVLANFVPLWWSGGEGLLLNIGWPMAAFALALVALFFGEMWRYEKPGGTLESLGVGVLALAYIGVLLSFVVQMRFLGPNGASGVAALASLVIVVKMGDTGAYTVGRLIGRTKLVPRLSPGKTIEGSAGGLLFSVAGAAFCALWLVPRLSGAAGEGIDWPGWIAYGVVVSIAGMLGDLAESLLKRDVGRKDSSTWMPGFGGVLDLLDSILLAAPVAYLFWLFGIVR